MGKPYYENLIDDLDKYGRENKKMADVKELLKNLNSTVVAYRRSQRKKEKSRGGNSVLMLNKKKFSIKLERKIGDSMRHLVSKKSCKVLLKMIL